MKLATYHQGDTIGIGAVEGESIIPLTNVAPDMQTLIEMGEKGLAAAKTAVSNASPATTIPLTDVTLLAPIPLPRRNVMCLGLNYADHAAESATAKGEKVELPQFPVIFNKATTSVNAPFGNIPLDANVSDKLDWEVELGIVIGRSGKNIKPDDALSYIFGYTIINDISARDLQRSHRQFFKGKSLDGACPIGPWIVTADEIDDPHSLNLSCSVNGITKQASNTRHLIFNLNATIDHLSRGMTLLPGDIIATGTPEGVGFARTPPEYLQDGDVIECEIEGVGLIRNRITAV